VPTISIQRIRDWIAAHRTADDYAFTSMDVALGIGGPPAEVFLLCEGGVLNNSLAAVTVGLARFYTNTVIGFDLGPRRTKDLIDRGVAGRGAEGLEWTLPRKAAA
jgi:hypothetical protein